MSEVLNSHPKLTLEEYLRAEEPAGQRREFLDGEVFPVPPSSKRHDLIRANLLAAIEPMAAQDAGKSLHGGLRLYVPRYQYCTYPDLIVLDGQAPFYADRGDTVTDAFIIAEVLSAASEPSDRGDKFKSYRSLPSLREYILVSQDQARVEHFRRTEAGDWASNDIVGLDWEIVITGLKGRIKVSDLYAGVNLD